MEKLDQLKLMTQYVEEPKSDLDVYETTDYKFVFAVILSSQTTDVQVNKIAPNLFATFPTLESFAEAEWQDVAKEINSIPFFNNKAKNLVKCANQLIDDHNKQIPSDMRSLVKLAGVGRKVANVIRNCVHALPGVVVDTHVTRVANRLGWVETTNATKIERELSEWIPEDFQSEASNYLVLFGRYICKAKKPECSTCVLQESCAFYKENNEHAVS